MTCVTGSRVSRTQKRCGGGNLAGLAFKNACLAERQKRKPHVARIKDKGTTFYSGKITTKGYKPYDLSGGSIRVYTHTRARAQCGVYGETGVSSAPRIRSRPLPGRRVADRRDDPALSNPRGRLVFIFIIISAPSPSSRRSEKSY